MEDAKTREGLPANAKRVFKGVIFEVWQWDQEMFDGTTQTFEKVWRYPTVEIIATVSDKIMIEKQDQPDRPGNITLVSGRADSGEDVDPLEEAKRELLEETGYKSNNWELLDQHSLTAKVLHQIYVFVAKNCQKIQEPQLDSGERIETMLVSFDEFLVLSDNPKFWVSPIFINMLLQARLDEGKKEELRKEIFG